MIHKMKQPIGLFAGDLLQRADQFFLAFDMLTREEPVPRHAAYFNLTHAIELLLKAYLASQDVSKKRIKALGHKLNDLSVCAFDTHCMPESDNFRKLTLQLNEMNNLNDFRYPSGYNLNVPRPDECTKITAPQRQLLLPLIRRCTLEAELRFQEDTRKWQGEKVMWSD